MSAQGVAVQRETSDTTEFSAAQRSSAAAPRPVGPFVFASGSRPLEGYTIKRGVGQGGFGEIYYATSDAGKEVALKLVRRNLEVELRGIRQCLNLKHPNLLDLYDIRQDRQGDTWVVMEYVADHCLEDVMAGRPDGLPLAEALFWIHGIGDGVAYLHNHGIVHRDLKPGNIYCDEGVVKIGDYGLSKFISCSRRSGHTESIGTVHYMAPEVANGRYGKEIDIYALGVILYELLTGRVPFDGESVGEVLMKHLTARPDVSMLSEPYRSVIARALEKDPDKRFGSVGEMLAALPPAEHGVRVAAVLPSIASASSTAGPTPRPQTAAPAAAPQPVITAEVVREEPIWRAVRENWRKFRAAWDQAGFNLPIKIILLVLGILLFLASANLLIPLAIVVVVGYGLYRCGRAIAFALVGPSAFSGRQEASARGPAYGAAAVAAAPYGRRARESAAPAMLVKSRRERFTELIGSMLLGAIAALAMCVVMVLISSYRDLVPRPEQCAWLALMSIAGTWAVLVTSKFWEGARGEPMLRRFVLMIIGLGLGLLAYAAAGVLFVSLPQDPTIPAGSGYRLPTSFYADGRPLAMAYMAVFGTLLAVIRWWLAANPMRTARLSLWSMFGSCLVAVVVAGVWHFPQPWLMMVAGAMSVAVQLASPWVPPRQRLRPQRKTVI